MEGETGGALTDEGMQSEEAAEGYPPFKGSEGEGIPEDILSLEVVKLADGEIILCLSHHK